MKLPTTYTIIDEDIEKVFGFLANPKYLNIYPKAPGIKTQRVEHINSLPYGLGKILRVHVKQNFKELAADIEIYKYDSPKVIGFKVIGTSNQKGKAPDSESAYILGEVTFDLELEDISGKTKLKGVVYINNQKSMFVRILLYVFFGVFGYYKNKKYIKDLGGLIEKYT